MNKLARKTELPLAPLLPDDLRSRIAALDDEQGQLLRDSGPLAEESIDDFEKERQYEKNIARQVEIDRERARYRAALQNMELTAGAAQTAAEAAKAAGLKKREADLLVGRVDHAKAFEAALAATVQALRDLVEASRAAAAAWPGTPPNFGAALSDSELTNLIAFEMFRQGHVPRMTGGQRPADRRFPSLPAPKSPSFDFTDQPQLVPSLASKIDEANNYALRILHGGPQ